MEEFDFSGEISDICQIILDEDNYDFYVEGHIELISNFILSICYIVFPDSISDTTMFDFEGSEPALREAINASFKKEMSFKVVF